MSRRQIPPDPIRSDDVRERILAAAANLLTSGGIEAATTRAVAAAADVQAPTIYRLYGDKDGLLNAVAERTLATFVATKSGAPLHADAVVDLRNGWDRFVEFGLANPAVFLLMYARPGTRSPAAEAGIAVLHEKVRRIAGAGRLRLAEERALALIHAGGVGTVLTLLEQGDARDPSLSTTARESILGTVLDEQAVELTGAGSAASALRASLADVDALTPGERHLLSELLTRIALVNEGAPRPEMTTG